MTEGGKLAWRVRDVENQVRDRIGWLETVLAELLTAAGLTRSDGKRVGSDGKRYPATEVGVHP